MKKRLLSCILVLVMLLGMIPTAAFAANYTDADPLPAGGYQVGDTYKGTTQPTAPDKTVWVETGSTTEKVKGDLKCTIKENHVHSKAADCYGTTLICGHDYGHTPSCYGDQTGNWVKCTPDAHGNHYNDLLIVKTHKLFPPEVCLTGLAFEALEALMNSEFLGDYFESFKSWLPKAISDSKALVSNERLWRRTYFCYEVEGGSLTCNHGDTHTDSCYELTCTQEENHQHNDNCYKWSQMTIYTWTLKADENKNGKPDDKESTYSIVYDVNGGKNGPATENGKLAGLTYDLSTTTPTHDPVGDISVVFVGWTENKADQILGMNDTAPSTITRVKIKEANVTVYAAWAYDTDGDSTPDYNDDKWTVTFNSDGGTEVESLTVVDGGKAVEPTAPTKANFNFAGWYLATGGEFDFDTPITGNITLTAKWTADLPEVLTKAYDWVKVELDDNAAAAHEMLEGLVPFVTVTHDAHGNIITAGSAKEWWGANPTKVLGKNLTGVKLGKDNNSIDLKINGVVTTTDNYTVTLKDGGTIEFVSDPGIFKDLNEVVKKAILRAVEILPEKADLSSIVKAINGAIEEVNKIPGVEIPLIIGDNLPDVITKQDILNFLDKLFSDGVGSFTYMVITVEKADAPTPTTYTVSFDANGGEGTMAAQIFTKGKEQALTANKFTKTDYVFSGWNTAADGSGSTYSDGQLIKVENNMTLYAQWEDENVPADASAFIHVHMDEATTADLNALDGTKQVRLESDKYRTLFGNYRLMAPMSVKSKANWWTENFAKKVTAQDITNVTLAGDKFHGASNKIVIPMTGNETYTVTLDSEEIKLVVYGLDISKLQEELGKIQLPELPNVKLDTIIKVIKLIRALKDMGLSYDQIIQLIEIAADGVSLNDAIEIAKILKGLDITWKDIANLFEVLNTLDKKDIQAIVDFLKKVDLGSLVAKLKQLEEIMDKLEGLNCKDVQEALEQLKNAATKENIEKALSALKDALEKLDGKDIQSQLNELLANLGQMDKEALIAKIKELIKNQIPDDALDCMTPDELKELLKGLITKHQYSLSCLCINISKKNAPIEPTKVTEDTVKNLLKDQVVVKCTNGKASHAPKSYGWIDGGVQIGKVTGKTCPITIVTWVYADAYNKDVAPHHSVTIEPKTVTFNLTWVNNIWALNVADVPVIEVACKIGEEVTVTHTVTFDYNYDSRVVRVPVEDGKTVSALDANRTGYVFDGWYLGSVKYNFATAVTGDITLVASWKVDRNNNGIPDEDEYLTVTYSDGVENKVVFADQVYDKLLKGDATPAFRGTPSRIGYTFKGWEPEVSKTVTKNVDYVAQWKRDYNRKPVIPSRPTAPSVKVKYLNTEDHVAYIIGYENGTIQPRGEITRAEVATIFFRLMTDKARSKYWTTENDFNDVAEGQWFNLAVSTLNAAGVIVDAEHGNFRPNDPITRAELAVMAAQFCTVEGKLPKISFTDVSKDHWAIDEIKLIEYAGWIEGYPDGTFRPDATITRAEAITIINRMLERAVEDSGMLEGMLTFIDCPTNEWFYEAVQEATNSHDYKRTREEVEDYGYCYEIWTELEENPDWAAVEKTWLSPR